jgi:prephenate dehydrogenase
VRALLADVGADVLAVSPEHHDLLVAFVSHVPQLAATTLMDIADRHEEEHRALLRLAAGGFRDMTRIAAGNPGIWPDIFTSNRDAVLDALDAFLGALAQVRELVAAGDRSGLLDVMERARAARRNLPLGLDPDAALVELRVPVPDRPGVLAEVTTLAGRLGVNIVDLEIAHSLEGGSGVMVIVVPAAGSAPFEAQLHEHGFHTSRVEL